MPMRRPSARHGLLAIGLGWLSACGGSGLGPTCTPTASYAPGVAYGPAVALATPAAVSITWTSESAVIGAIEFGPTASYGTVLSEPSARTRHELRVSGLSALSTIHYRLRHDGVPLGGDHATRTPVADRSAAPFRFAVVGDTGTGCPEEIGVLARIGLLSPDFVWNTGDVAYYTGSAAEVRNGFLIPFADLSERVPVFLTFGNHDVITSGGQPLADAVVLPVNDEEGTEYYYAFDWGNLHGICLDSNRPFGAGTPQRLWLERDLASASAASATWLVVAFHHPAYSSSSHGSDPTVDAELVPLFDAHGVDVVFNGHDHAYERTHPMVGGTPTSTTGGPAYLDPVGTIYVVTGGGGQSLYTAGVSAFTAKSESAHHAVRVDVAGATLTATAVRADGTTLETFSITKSP
jgi:hypothetical protein